MRHGVEMQVDELKEIDKSQIKAEWPKNPGGLAFLFSLLLPGHHKN